MVRPAEVCGFSQTGPIRATLLEGQDAPGQLPGRTPYSFRPGDEFIGALSPRDVDLISITLTAGQSYRFLLEGRGTTPGLDTVLSLYSADGRLIASDDDGGAGLSSLLRFSPTENGTYFLDVRGFSGAAGEYRLAAMAVDPPPPATVDDMARYLTDGYWASIGEGRRVLDTGAGNVITVNLAALTAEGQRLAQAALDAWEMVANVDFRVVTGAAQITFDDNEEGAFATFVQSGGRTLSSFVNVSTDWLEDYGTGVGSYSFQTYVHEIGHALGLGHQGPYNAFGDYAFDAIFRNDSWSLSIMSYFDQQQNTFDPGSFGFVVTPMMADILAIQSLYGAPVRGATAGDTIWGEGSNLQNFLGDFFRGEFGRNAPMREIALTIFDVGGQDRVVFSTDRTNQSVWLEGEQRWNVFGGTGNVTVARGTVIEEYVAGSGNDTVVGNQVANRLVGNSGNDSLSGAGGNDTLEGGAGNDTLDGGQGVDRLVGGAGNDVFVIGQAGDVVVELARGGTDLVRSDISHTLAAQVEILELMGSAAVNGTGNELANRIVGNAAANSLSGGAGDDTLEGGAGADTLIGGEGRDRLVGGEGGDTYILGDAGDTVVEVAGGGTDVVQSGLSQTLAAQVEHLVLTGGAAVNGTGNELANRLTGNAAANTLSGRAGRDTLDGGAGNDTLTGGIGEDVFVFAVGAGRDRITDFADDIDSLQIAGRLLGAGAPSFAALQAIGREFADRVEFQFSGGEVLTVFGVTRVAQLSDDVIFV
jgi:serralysin